ncbi:SdpI family protein [Candidatus Micrarchaeota archaeon]|nr:SdpI family protein [Candidatus Micrarchaeota archaeon]
MKVVQWAILGLLVLSFAGSYLAFEKLPEMVASHWNEAGEVNGYMDRGMGAFLMPVIAVGLAGLFYLLPRIDPLKRNIMQFSQYYEGFILFFVLFLVYMHFLTLAWNLGYSFDMGRMMVPAIGLLFIYVGILCGASRQNWFIGVKTPWTLSSERVWEKTHSLAKKVYILCGLLWIAIGLLRPDSMLLLLGIVIVASLGLFVYSYFVYRKERERPSKKEVSPPVSKVESGESAKAFPLAGKVPGGEAVDSPMENESGMESPGVPPAPVMPAKKAPAKAKKKGKSRSKKSAKKKAAKVPKKAPKKKAGKKKAAGKRK